MATVRPFKGLRPDPAKAEMVSSPPYDVISSEEAREMAKNNPISFLHVIKPEIDLPEEIDIYDEKVYLKGKENLERLKKEGALIKDQEEKFYLYTQIMGSHEQTGLVCVSSVEEYDKGIIKKHEHTREDKEIDRTKHIETLNAQAGPVFLTYKNTSFMKELMNRAMDSARKEYDFEVDGVRHIFYVIDDENMKKEIEDAFDKIDYMYIADGHHRSAAALRVRNNRMKNNPNHSGKEPYNYFLTVIFPDDQMYIMDYNRIVKDLNGFTKEEFIDKISQLFDIEKADRTPYKPENKHEFGMFLDGEWYKLIARKGTFDENDPVKSLDVAILQDNLLGPVLGIENPRKDKRINFVGGIRGLKYLEEKVNSGEYAVAFSMYPTSIDDLMRVADAGQVMPPKSTWFEPKLRSGMVIHEL